jgi:hypothetical protein
MGWWIGGIAFFVVVLYVFFPLVICPLRYRRILVTA